MISIYLKNINIIVYKQELKNKKEYFKEKNIYDL